MKKIILLMLVFTLMVISCGKPQAQTNLETMLKKLQNGDISEIKKLNSNFDINQNTEIVPNAFLKGYKKMTYKIKDTKVEGDKVTINLDIKIPNLSEYFSELSKGILVLAFSNIDKSEEEIKKLLDKYETDFFSEKIASKDLKFIDKNINVVFKKVGKEWVIDETNEGNKEFYNILTFGFLELGETSSSDLNNSDSIPTKYFTKGERGIIFSTVQTVIDVKIAEKSLNHKPKDGNEFVVIKLLKENIVDGVVPGADIDQYQIETKDKVLIKPEIDGAGFGQYNYDDLPKGNKIEQILVFEVPKGQAKTLNIIDEGNKVAVYDLGL